MLAAIAAPASSVATSPHPHITDHAQSLYETTLTQLETESAAIERDTGVEVFVLMVRDLNGMSAREAALASPVWSHDREQVMLLVSMSDRLVRIEASPTVQTRVPDSRWAALIESAMLPSLRMAKQGAAVRAGMTAIGQELRGQRRALRLQAAGDIRSLRDMIFVLIAGALAMISFNRARHMQIRRGGW